MNPGKTSEELFKAYEGESKSRTRLLAYSEQADAEERFYTARLFRAMSVASGIHALNNLRLLGPSADTYENISYSLSRGTEVARLTYNRLVELAEEERDERAAEIFRWMRDAESEHIKLYERALDDTAGTEGAVFNVCTRCGCVVEGAAPDECPVCGRPRSYFIEAG